MARGTSCRDIVELRAHFASLRIKARMKALVAAALFLASSAALATNVPEPPAIDAKSYAVVDFQSGALLASRDPDAQVEPASITKVMTVYIAFDYIKQGRIKPTDEVLI